MEIYRTLHYIYVFIYIGIEQNFSNGKSKDTNVRSKKMILSVARAVKHIKTDEKIVKKSKKGLYLSANCLKINKKSVK